MSGKFRTRKRPVLRAHARVVVVAWAVEAAGLVRLGWALEQGDRLGGFQVIVTDLSGGGKDMKNQVVETGDAGARRHFCKVPNGVNLGVGVARLAAHDVSGSGVMDGVR